MSNNPLWEMHLLHSHKAGEEWGRKDEGRDEEQASGSCINFFSTIHLEWNRGCWGSWDIRPEIQVNHL